MNVQKAEGKVMEDSGSNAEDVDVSASGVNSTPSGHAAAQPSAAPPPVDSMAPPRRGEPGGESILSTPPEETNVTLTKLGVGTIIDEKYRVDEILGRGAMGVVVAATHLALRERVALKFLNVRVNSRGEDFHSRFRREAQLSAKLRNEHIARVIDVGMWQGKVPFMVMEHLVGMDLSNVIKARGPLPIDVALDYIVQVCEGLAEAHGMGVVHRDLKPSNLFVTQRPDGSDLIKILDFGISKWSVEDEVGELTQSGVVLGSPKYMAVEQLFGSAGVDARADIWSIGAIFYTMLCGKSPYDFPTITRLCAELATNNPPPSVLTFRPEVYPALDAALMRCFLRDRDQRVQTVADLAGDLLDAVEAPFAPAVRQNIQIALDPKRARELLGKSSGGHAMGTGQYRALNLMSSTGSGAISAAIMPSNPPRTSLSPATGAEDTMSRLRPKKKGLVIGALVAVAAVVIFFAARSSDKKGPDAAVDLPPAVTPTTAAAGAASPAPSPAETSTAMAAATGTGNATAPGTASADPGKNAASHNRYTPPPRQFPVHTPPPTPVTSKTPAPPVATPIIPAPPVAAATATTETPKKKANPLEDRQ